MTVSKSSTISATSYSLGWLGTMTYLLFYIADMFLRPQTPCIVSKLLLFFWAYPLCYGFLLMVGFRILYRDEKFMIAACGALLGIFSGIGSVIVILNLYEIRLFGFYIVVFSFFHFSEYFTTAITNPTAVSLDSYLLNHSVSYWAAAIICWTEFFLEFYFLPFLKSFWYLSIIGGLLCVFGEFTRKLAMLTAQKNFNHIVQVKRLSGHKLVTHGIYSLCRHPSYVGWFWWSIGTQLLLVNPVCTVSFAITSWIFFNERVHFEEMTLLNFFGEDYLEYQMRTRTGLPFIRGYVVDHS